MANRHLSRSIVLQSLFEWDFSGKPEELKPIIDRSIAEFAPGHNDNAFIYTLAETVQRKVSIIDDIIMKAAPEWPLKKFQMLTAMYSAWDLPSFSLGGSR